MTETRMSYSVFGTPGAERIVVLAGTGLAVTTDPLPSVTADHDIQVLAVSLAGAAIEDPGAFGGQTPAEQTAVALAELIRRQDLGERTVGVIAYREAGDVTLRAVAELGTVVDRLALVAVPLPEGALDRDELGELLARISTETLVINGAGDETAGEDEATWLRDHLSGARAESATAAAMGMSLSDVWERVLTHVAPGTHRRRDQ